LIIPILFHHRTKMAIELSTTRHSVTKVFDANLMLDKLLFMIVYS